jgi:signal transduction histidine kinase
MLKRGRMINHRKVFKHANVKDRLNQYSLRRAALTGGASGMATCAIAAVVFGYGTLDSGFYSFLVLNLTVNIVRLIFGLIFILKPLQWSTVLQSKLYEVTTHIANVTWLMICYGVFQAHGLRSDQAVLCLLVSCGLIAGSQMSFASMIQLGLWTIATLGLGIACLVVNVEPNVFGFCVAGLAVIFTVFTCANAVEIYKLLRKTEMKLAAQQRDFDLMKSLLNAVPGYMTLLDRELNYIMVNDEFANFVKHDVVGERFGFMNQDAEFSRMVHEFKDSNDQHLIRQITIGSIFENNHFLVSMMKIQNGLIAILTMNIEEQKRTEQQLIKAQSDAEHAGRLAALGEMVSSVAHEIRNPLTVISGRSSHLAKLASKAQLTEELVKDDTNKIIAMVERISTIVETVLNFGRGHSESEMTVCAVKSLIEDAVYLTAIKRKAAHVHLKESTIAPELATTGHSIQLGQVLVNIIHNAIDAIEQDAEKWIEITARAVGQTLEIRVTDSGHGIPKDVRDHLLDPFFTTKPAGKGTGLGLSISRGIIERHKGKLWIDAEAPHTTFVIELPHVLISKKITPAA